MNWTSSADPEDWTPWLGAIQITAPDGTVICWTPSGGNERAHADLIVRAVNSHEALLDALKFYDNPDVYKPHPHGLAFDNRDLSYVARAAIAKATGDAS